MALVSAATLTELDDLEIPADLIWWEQTLAAGTARLNRQRPGRAG